MTFMTDIDHKFPWSFLGFLAGLIFGIFGIYTVFFYSKAPDLRVEVLSSAPVLSIHENVQELNILFKGKNIQQDHQVLTLVSLKLINRGNVAVKPGDFDQRDLPTIRLKDGELVKADVLDTSEDYLEKVFSETTSTSNSIKFTPFILEPGHFISLKLLVLHNDGKTPTLEVTGKIANLAGIPVILPSQTTILPTQATAAFSGDFIVQFIRALSYGLGTVTVLLSSLLVFDFIRNSRDRIEERKRRRKQVRAQELLNSLDRRMRHELEPIYRALIADEQRSSVMGDKIHSLLPVNGTNNEEMFFDELESLVPHFNRKFFRGNHDAINQLTKLIELIDIIY